MVPKSAREVALADFSFTVTALPVLSPVPSEEALLGAAGGHREREHGGEGAGRDLTQVVHNVPFLNIIQTTVWGVGLGMRGIRAARESKKRNYAPNLS